MKTETLVNSTRRVIVAAATLCIASFPAWADKTAPKTASAQKEYEITRLVLPTVRDHGTETSGFTVQIKNPAKTFAKPESINALCNGVQSNLVKRLRAAYLKDGRAPEGISAKHVFVWFPKFAIQCSGKIEGVARLVTPADVSMAWNPKAKNGFLVLEINPDEYNQTVAYLAANITPLVRAVFEQRGDGECAGMKFRAVDDRREEKEGGVTVLKMDFTSED